MRWIAISLLATATSVAAAPCDMATLSPLLDGDAMAQCTAATQFEIPHIQPYSRGYDRVSDQICLSSACGRAIQSIQAVQASECELTARNVTTSLVGVTATLYAQHLTPVLDLCGDDPSLYGPAITPDPAAMDASKECTRDGVASYFWGKQRTVEQCMGVSLKTLLSRNASDPARTVTIECPACELLQNATEKIPKCALPTQTSTATSFYDYFTHAFAFCDALTKLTAGEGITGVLKSQLKNTSAVCAFNSQAMQLVLQPLEQELLGNTSCIDMLFNPRQPLSSDAKQTVCESCPLAKSAIINTVDLPTCQTQFGQSYDVFLKDAVAGCSAGVGGGSKASASTRGISGSSSRSGASVSDQKPAVPASTISSGVHLTMCRISITLAAMAAFRLAFS